MKVSHVKRSRSILVMLGYVYTKYAEFLGDFFSEYIKYILVAFGLAPAAGIVINNVWITGFSF